MFLHFWPSSFGGRPNFSISEIFNGSSTNGGYYVMLYFVQYNKISLNSTSLHGRVWIFSAQNDYKTHWNFILTLIAAKMIYRNQNLATVLFYQHSMYFANTETTVTIMASWKWLLFCICFKTIGGYNRHKAGQLSFKVHEIRSTIDVLT